MGRVMIGRGNPSSLELFRSGSGRLRSEPFCPENVGFPPNFPTTTEERATGDIISRIRTTYCMMSLKIIYSFFFPGENDFSHLRIVHVVGECSRRLATDSVGSSLDK